MIVADVSQSVARVASSLGATGVADVSQVSRCTSIRWPRQVAQSCRRVSRLYCISSTATKAHPKGCVCCCRWGGCLWGVFWGSGEWVANPQSRRIWVVPGSLRSGLFTLTPTLSLRERGQLVGIRACLYTFTYPCQFPEGEGICRKRDGF